MSLEQTDELNPLVSVWLRPRKTIEHIVDRGQTRWVLALAVIGGISGVLVQLITYHLSDGRILVLGAIGGAVLAIVNLYIASAAIAGVGRLMRGRASAQAVRAALAWSQLPLIAGALIGIALIGTAYALPGKEAASDLLLAASGLIAGACALWSIVLTLLMISRIERFGFWRTVAAYIVGTLGAILAFSVVLAVGIRTFLFQPFNIPSGAMAPTLLVGDYFFANKLAYGYSQFSLPFGPWEFSGRLFASDPQRGDIVVFANPKDPSVTYVKRVVGVGGDRVQMKQGQLVLNGTPVERERLSDAVGDFCGTSSVVRVKRLRETLPNGASYETLDCVDNGFYDNTSEYVVPAGYAFVMGDNRDNSTDSRVLSAVGYIPLDNIYGRASMIFFSRGVGPHGESVVRSERIGTLVR